MFSFKGAALEAVKLDTEASLVSIVTFLSCGLMGLRVANFKLPLNYILIYF